MHNFLPLFILIAVFVVVCPLHRPRSAQRVDFFCNVYIPEVICMSFQFHVCTIGVPGHFPFGLRILFVLSLGHGVDVHVSQARGPIFDTRNK